MFRRILVANRGEIAVRIIRACREMNIETVAVYSKADINSLHVQMATDAVCIGEAPANKSYLNMENILTAALLKSCDAIHPGYGFLAENSDFARMTVQSGLEFIGPSFNIIADMGNKEKARKLMKEGGVPIISGSEELISSPEEAEKIAEEIGYPVILKAASGGGGKGMRKVYSPEQMKNEFMFAKSEAGAAFGDDSIYMEKLIEHAKHIEVQILADKQQNIVHLGERDCSVQRKNQKMIEEAPCRILKEEIRQKICEAAVKAAKAVNYTSAGTVEFLMTEDESFYFMEMNTRVQVEHPVTEMVTGIDIVKEQIKIAFGLPLSFKQEDIQVNGYAIECRINAEDPKNNFMPSSGKLNVIHLSGGHGVRIDSLIYQGCEISPYYDSMLAKLIVHGKSRQEALRKLRRSLEEFIIEGVSTNLSLLYLLTYEREFIKGSYNTGFVEKRLGDIQKFGEKFENLLLKKD